jgi:8-oxo-dGTP pyrophosphatase MutT (NUDIX family)
VAVKAFVLRGRELLLVQESDGGAWELPGGRIEVGEERLSPREVLSRELREELGPAVAVEIGVPVAAWTRRKPNGSGFAFLVGLLCSYRGGEIRLSAEHAALDWVSEDGWRRRLLADGYETALAAFWEDLPR